MGDRKTSDKRQYFISGVLYRSWYLCSLEHAQYKEQADQYVRFAVEVVGLPRDWLAKRAIWPQSLECPLFEHATRTRAEEFKA
jgi:hypothetical protein